MKNKNPSNLVQIWIPLILGIFTLTVFLIFGYYPEGRVWGLNFWAYFSEFPPILFFLVFIALMFVAFFISRNRTGFGPIQGSEKSTIQTHILISLASAFACSILFWVFRAKTHFLGDGYHIVARLGSLNPHVKITELGETYIHLVMAQFLNVIDKETAIKVYQISSVAAGFAFVITVSLFSLSQFPNSFRRFLFTLGILTSGIGLLFFGHVEHYSWHILILTNLTLFGVLCLQGKTKKIIFAAIFFLSVFFHVIALAALPAVVFVLFHKTRLAHMRRATWILILIPILTGGLLLFRILYQSNYFFRFAFIPLMPIEITPNGYTLFSIIHLLDILNLLILLLPSLLLVIWVLGINSRWIISQPHLKFLLIMSATAAFSIFIIDPKLGMPRDWDLFSIVAVPLSVLFYLVILSEKLIHKLGLTPATISVVLSLALLIPRIASQASASVSISHLMNYMNLDREKNRGASQLLWEYYASIGDLDAVNKEQERFESEYPEMNLLSQATQANLDKEYTRCISLSQQAIKLNPLLWNVYINLGVAQFGTGKYDSALKTLRVADGINPNNSSILTNLGYAWKQKGEYSRAEDAWVRAYKNDTTATSALVFLVEYYKKTHQVEKQIEYLKLLSSKIDAPIVTIAAMAKYYLDTGMPDSAAFVYRRALNQGVDSTAFDKLFNDYPVFRRSILGK